MPKARHDGLIPSDPDPNGTVPLADFAHQLATQWLEARMEYADLSGNPLTWNFDVHDTMATIDRVTRECGLVLSTTDLCALTELVDEDVRRRFAAVVAARSRTAAS